MQNIEKHEKKASRAMAVLAIAGLVLVLFSMFASARTRANERPFLMLDTGGHMALVRDMVFTPDGKQLISASDDKTIRIWSLATGKTVKILRGQIDAGEGGKIFELALSPDGRYLAASGFTKAGDMKSHPIRIYDLESHELVGLLEGHSEPVNSIDFSPDGRFLVSGGRDRSVVLWNVSTGAIIRRLNGHSDEVNAVRFSPRGDVIASGGDDNIIRIWRARDGKSLLALKGHTSQVTDVAFSPNGELIASASVDATIRFWRATNGRPIGKPISQGGEVTSLSFSPDGRFLLSGAANAPYHPHIWKVRTGEKKLAYKGHDNIALSTAISTDGKLAATAGGSNNEIHVWEMGNGKLVRKLTGIGQAVLAAAFSPDGSEIAWGHTGAIARPNDLNKLEHVLRLPRGERETGVPRPIKGATDRFRRVIPAIGNLASNVRITNKFGFFDTIDVFRNDKPIGALSRTTTDGYAHNAYSFMLGGNAVISGGGQGYLSAYGLDGTKLGEYVGHTSDVWAIAVSPDGARLLSASDDQTVRLWNVETGENIVTLFHARNGEWVMWTPQGYFSASPDGDEHVGWHINQGAEKQGQLVTAAQLKRHFYRPDIIKRAILLGSAEAAIAEAADTGFKLKELLRRKPPVMKILDPASDARVKSSSIKVSVEVGDNIDPVSEFVLTVNGRRINPGDLPEMDGSSFTTTFEVPLVTGVNNIEIAATNAVGQSTSRISVQNERQIAEKRGTLFLLTIGVDDYKFFSQDLAFAGADAKAIHTLVRDKAGRMHNEVKGVLLAQKGGKEPNAENIKKALEMFTQARPEDTIVIFLAGHGVNQGRDYLFLPSDAKHAGRRWKPRSVVNWRLLQDAIEKSQGRRIMLVDTCHAGNAFNPRLIKDADDANIAVFAATDAETLAQERPDLGHGVFTHAVLEGLKGKADTSLDRLIDARELGGFVIEAVKAMTKGKQEPTTRLPKLSDFILSQL